ncbi:MAG: hypothetical protein JSW06_05430 [Thermoplasmatales archaeon]|nr:MAG: hypothetical protein JSW06_05430 [Thermoplasmatales archaeon]
MENRMLKKSLVIGVIFAVILVSIPTITADTEIFNNSFVLIAGKSNSTNCLSLWWRIGLFIPVLKRHFFVVANGEEGESLNVLIFSLNNGLATYYDYEDIRIELTRARGVFYWGGKSLLIDHSEPPPVLVLCRTERAYVTT